MNVPGALVLQSIPFAWLALAPRFGSRDLFAILYIVCVGLLMSVIVSLGDSATFDQVISAIGDFD